MILKDIIKKFDKSNIKAGDGLEKGNYPLYTCSPIINKYLNDYLYEAEALIISTGGNFSIHYVNGKFNYSTDCYVFNTDKYNLKYLYYYLLSKKDDINKMFRGAGLKHLNKNEFVMLNLKEISENEQCDVVNQLDKINEMIELRKNEIEKCNNIIKSQFVEMFGTNKKSKYPYESLENLTLKITDGKHGGCKGEKNSGYYFVGATEIYNDKINYQTAKEITKNDFKKDYKRCDLKNNDFVIVNTGATIGKSAIVNSDLADHTLLQKSVALIRTKQELINPIYLKYCYDANPDMYNKGNGCARINLLLSQIKETMIPVPPIELQNKFAQIVEQIDKQKFVGTKIARLLGKITVLCYNYIVVFT